MMRSFTRIAVMLFLLLSLSNCQKDDTSFNGNSEENQDSYSLSIIDGNEIPIITQYLETTTDKNFRITLELKDFDYSKNRELPEHEINQSRIVQVTNEHGLSNYTYRVNPTGNVQTFNTIKLIVKETTTGTYS